jgi:hypothetical protein
MTKFITSGDVFGIAEAALVEELGEVEERIENLLSVVRNHS